MSNTKEMSDKDEEGDAGSDEEFAIESSSEDETESDEDEEDYVPGNYLFPSFMAYMLWGPFASENEKLPLFVLDDANKTTVKSRAQKRAHVKAENAKEREGDRSAVRGFSTDQRISIKYR